MKNYRNILCASILFAGMLFLGTGCTSSSQKQTADLPRISFKDYLEGNDKVAIGTDEIESIEYIPLELTDDDASLVGSMIDITLTEEYFFLLCYEDFKVFQFDRKRKYIRTVTRQGEGPGELQDVGFAIWADDEVRELYVSEPSDISVFSYDGRFKRKISRNGRMMAYAEGEKLDWVVETYREYFPLDIEEYFGIGVFRYNEDNTCDTLYMKKDMSDTSVASLFDSDFLWDVSLIVKKVADIPFHAMTRCLR